MKKAQNKEILEGRLWDFDLTKKTVQNKNSKNFGKEFWSGTINIATDEAGLNVIPVHYAYVVPTFGNGKTDSRYAAIEKIVAEEKTWQKVGKDGAEKIRLTPSADVNVFYPEGSKEPVKQQRNEGGFITFVKELAPEGSQRNKFTLDILINEVKIVEPKEDSDEQPYAKIHGLIFNYNNDVAPFDLVAHKERAISYFEGLGASQKEPVFTQVWGPISCTTVKIQKTIESAFGDPVVETVDRTRREWVVEGARITPYDFGDEKVLTKEEVQTKIQAMNVRHAEVKAAAEEYYNERKSKASNPPSALDPTTMAGPLDNISNANFEW